MRRIEQLGKNLLCISILISILFIYLYIDINLYLYANITSILISKFSLIELIYFIISYENILYSIVLDGKITDRNLSVDFLR